MQDQDLTGIVIQVVVLVAALALLVLFAWDDHKSRRERAAEARDKAEDRADSEAPTESEKIS